ncbi:hypothetical protein [Candidatus Cyanaurora vandensis]|uniref:hypothetical protein n=1 Tax=Candidatus Cyanaurora vandensis TaxID=2714958 RepID=UPI00257D9779|nr:hypothetical protein [Candidatus Cyanaurora vandensis]
MRLPVSGLDLWVHPPTGAEDLLLAEAGVCDTRLALAVVQRLARSRDGQTVDWANLCVSDLDALLLQLRQELFGDWVRSDLGCPGCSQRFDLSFRLSDYLQRHVPRRARGVEPAADGWFRLKNSPVSFRLPTGADQLALTGDVDPEQLLVRRCIRPDPLTSRWRRRVEQAMGALAPSLSQDLAGQCPACGLVVLVFFDAQQFTLRELCDQARGVYEEIHLLAGYYHWSEAEILALPRVRRRHYAEFIRQAVRS